MRSLLRVEVKRSEWRNGSYANEHGMCGTYLSAKADDGTTMRCCLGFLGNSLGFSDDEMACIENPRQVRSWEEGEVFYDEAIEYNDRKAIGPEERERRIRAWGCKYGINFVFVD